MTISWMPRGLVVAVIALLASNVSAGERSYTFYDIFFPACSADPYTEAADINDSGVVVGNYEPGDCVIHGFTWFNGVMTDLDSTYQQGTFRAAESIARIGTVLGLGTPDEVLVLDDELLQIMPIPVGCVEQANPNNINDAETMVVGQCKNDGGGLPSVYWIDQGTGLRLDMFPDLPEDASGDARDVNDAGVVVGESSRVNSVRSSGKTACSPRS